MIYLRLISDVSQTLQNFFSTLLDTFAIRKCKKKFDFLYLSQYNSLI